MAEGWARKLLGPTIEAYSAGTAPHPLNELAVLVMREAGVDISDHKSKSLESLKNIHFDLIITVCDSAAKSCPLPPVGTKAIHAPFDDPPKLALNAPSKEAALAHYRRVRDEIKDFVASLDTLSLIADHSRREYK
jgi:arsenate reductase